MDLNWGGQRQRIAHHRPFKVGENVLVYFDQLLYEAKVLQRSYIRDARGWRYFIHYFSWNKRWDEWVTQSRVVERNAPNMLRLEALSSRLKTGKFWRSKHLEKPQRAIDDIKKDITALGKKLSVTVPPQLYYEWIEDKALSLHVGMICRVPTPARKFRQVLSDFQDHLVGDGELSEQRMAKLNDLVAWFDENFQLLRYHTESETSPPGDCFPSEAYGALHLLRMLFADFRVQPVEGGFEDLDRLLHFLEANRRVYFPNYNHLQQRENHQVA